MPKSSTGGGGGGNTSETEDSGGRRDSPLSASALSGGGNVNASSGGMGLNQSLSIKQELMDAQQQQQREHHVSLPPEYLPVSCDNYFVGIYFENNEEETTTCHSNQSNQSKNKNCLICPHLFALLC